MSQAKGGARAPRLLSAVAGLGLLLAACGGNGGPSAHRPGASPSAEVAGNLDGSPSPGAAGATPSAGGGTGSGGTGHTPTGGSTGGGTVSH